jgi:transposase
MSKNNITKLFPFMRVKITEVEVKSDQRTIVKIMPDNRYSPICSGCLQKVKHIHSYNQRAIYDLSMSGTRVEIEYLYRKVYCPECGVKVEYHDFIEPYSRVTKRFAYYIYGLCKVMSIIDVSDHTGLSWDQIRRIDKHTLENQFRNPIPENLEILCIDEISIKKRHRYLTIIADYISGRVIGVVKDRTYNAVSRFLKSLPKQIRKNIKAVAMDMWDPYIKAFKEHCPKADLVFDPFHVIASFSRTIDKIRAQEYRNAEPNLRKFMKRSRFLLLKNPQNLNDKERPKLKTILANNELLSKVYILKEYLKRLWQYKYAKWAVRFLDYWCDLAKETGNRYLIQFTKTLYRYSYGIINHCKFPIHTNRLEGINNKIKLIKRKAYGYRDLHYFKLKIMQATSN